MVGRTTAARSCPRSWSCQDADGPADIDTAPDKTFGTVANGVFDRHADAARRRAAAEDLQRDVHGQGRQHRDEDGHVHGRGSEPAGGDDHLAARRCAVHDRQGGQRRTGACSDPDGPQDIDPDENKTFGTVPVGQRDRHERCRGADDRQDVHRATCTDLAGNTTTKTAHVLRRRQSAGRDDRGAGRRRDVSARVQPAGELGLHRSRRRLGHQDARSRRCRSARRSTRGTLGPKTVLGDVHRPGGERRDEGRDVHRHRRAAGHHDRDPGRQRDVRRRGRSSRRATPARTRTAT